jgi:hypothetical protein
MSKYNSDHVEISQFEKSLLPITYSFIYNFRSKIRRKNDAYYGLDVEAYKTTSFYPSGHHKPISKIINLKVFENKDGNS